MTNPEPKTLYVSGPMTGLPDFNYPQFNAVAAELRALGYTVLNPAEAPDRTTWLDYMRHDLTLLAQADAICSLPDWGASRGAAIEHAIAAMLGLEARPAAHWLQHAIDTNPNPCRQRGGINRLSVCGLPNNHTGDHHSGPTGETWTNYEPATAAHVARQFDVPLGLVTPGPHA